jgi:hypothetical protein
MVTLNTSPRQISPSLPGNWSHSDGTMSDAPSERTRLVLAAIASCLVTSILWWVCLDYAMDAKVQALRTSLQSAKDQLHALQGQFENLNNESHELRLRDGLRKAGVSDDEIEMHVRDIIK